MAKFEPTMSDRPSPDLSAAAWEQRYQNGQTGWDLGAPAPPLVQLLAGAQAPRPGRMAVLGAGRGHDALLFAAHRFDVVGFDLAPSAIAAAQQAAQSQQLPAQFLQRDIFTLGTEFAAQFDYVLEHTCFCAIDPELRPAYVQLIKTLLRSRGELLALFWAHQKSGGPPFGTTVAALRQLFEPNFVQVLFEPATNSIPSRRGEEYLVRYQVREE